MYNRTNNTHKNLISTTLKLLSIFMIFSFVGCGSTSSKAALAHKRIKKIFVAMDTLYGLNMSFKGASIAELKNKDLLKGFEDVNLSGGETLIKVNKQGTGYTITEQQIGEKIADKLVEKLKSNARQDKDGNPMVSSENGDFTITIGV